VPTRRIEIQHFSFVLLVPSALFCHLMYNDTKYIVDPWVKEIGHVSAIQQRPYTFSMNNS